MSPGVSPTVPIDEIPFEDVAPPVVSRRVPRRLAAQDLSAALPRPVPPPPIEIPVALAAPSPIAVEQALLGDIVKALRKQGDPRTALVLLEDHAQRFPGTVLAPEAGMLRAEALLGLGRKAEALSELDRLSLGSTPNRDERFVLRGELRAAAGRWREAREDFEAPLSVPAASGMAAKARDVKERALWGRASARSHLGDDLGARADLALYLRSFPSGRFATQATALLQGSP
jgi:tetratricopeptide (TPR) repeat protein